MEKILRNQMNLEKITMKNFEIQNLPEEAREMVLSLLNACSEAMQEGIDHESWMYSCYMVWKILETEDPERIKEMMINYIKIKMPTELTEYFKGKI